MTHLAHALPPQDVKDPDAPLQEELREEAHAQLGVLGLRIVLHRRLSFVVFGVMRVSSQRALCAAGAGAASISMDKVEQRIPDLGCFFLGMYSGHDWLPFKLSALHPAQLCKAILPRGGETIAFNED